LKKIDNVLYMQTALTLAERGRFTARPNPCVGAVLVREGVVVGEGTHAYYGGDHAEVMALKQAGERARGATCYVTLEPCSHHGKTPPCTEALIRAGVKKVVVATLDPNPLVNGQGIRALRAAGIEVEVGLLALSAQQQNRGFFQRMQSQRPRVIAKSAMSLDGRTAMASGESFWITGPEARAQVQLLRAASDAVISGRGTVQIDDPALTVRDEAINALPHFKQPKRIILDSQGAITQAKLMNLEGEAWQVTTGAQSTWKNHHTLPAVKGQVSLPDLLTWLHAMPCNQVMVEAGAVLTGAFLEAGLVDEWHVFIAPKLLGSRARPLCGFGIDTMAEAKGLELQAVNRVGQDLHCIYQAV
jgi:diaminohydroxyphosphoribosylaminopyrimidine deaminase/5-amino-6-(5-phosphoribosylamino)uracil reductase